MSTPGRNAVVVLVTDGIPNGCNSTVDAAAMVAAEGFAGTPSIKTYVVGLGATSNLDPIALAGSGGETHYIPATGDVALAVTSGLQSIAHATTCVFTVPAGLDVHLVNVEVVIGGMVVSLRSVTNAAGCGALTGWYYDNPLQPTRLLLCPASCDLVKSTPNAGARILYGCTTVPP
jgi:hypothetical protein